MCRASHQVHAAVHGPSLLNRQNGGEERKERKSHARSWRHARKRIALEPEACPTPGLKLSLNLIAVE